MIPVILSTFYPVANIRTHLRALETRLETVDIREVTPEKLGRIWTEVYSGRPEGQIEIPTKFSPGS